MTPAVQLHDVQVAVAGRVLLQLPRLCIEPGERVAIVGPNGAGKSTLLRLMAGLPPAPQAQVQGVVQVLGRSLGPTPLPSVQRRALRRETGVLMQGLHLVPSLSARDNVLVGTLGHLQGAHAWRSLLRWYPPALVAEADAALAALGLAALAEVRADRLSGGERQKVALARVQLQRPRLLLADEPTSALDPAATAQVCAALVAAAAEPGRTLVTVVHDLELLPRLARRVIGLADGHLQWDLPASALTPHQLQALYRSCAAPAATGRALSPPTTRLASA